MTASAMPINFDDQVSDLRRLVEVQSLACDGLQLNCEAGFQIESGQVDGLCELARKIVLLARDLEAKVDEALKADASTATN